MLRAARCAGGGGAGGGGGRGGVVVMTMVMMAMMAMVVMMVMVVMLSLSGCRYGSRLSGGGGAAVRGLARQAAISVPLVVQHLLELLE
mmetsp:Transcript_75269/g.161244  ORF Transcript_75269/g.161244 Transcript_75269/m.161244 type:complete len:88 (+) Transcript_75269:547-810(+)